MMNAILAAVAGNAPVLLVLPLIAYYLRGAMHRDNAQLRKEMADGHKSLRREIAGVSDKVSKLTERVARIEGRLFPCSPEGECLDGTGGA